MSIHLKTASALAFVFGLGVVSGCGSSTLRSSGNDNVLGNGDSGSDGGRDGGSDSGLDAGDLGDAGADAGSGDDGGCGGGMDGGMDGGVPISYAMDIQPSFNARCISCHDEATHSGNLVLSAPSSRAQLVNIPSTCDSSVLRVVPADTAGSMLWRKCKPDPSRCLMPMPRGTLGLGIIAPAEFDNLEQWILQGAMDN